MSFSCKEVSQTIAAQFGGCQDGDDDTPLHIAAYAGNVDELNKILSRGPPTEAINQRNHLGCTPLRLAATGGHTQCLQTLLDHGASVDIPDVKGQTPLLVAVTNCYYTCAEELLKRGANPNGDAKNCSTPLSQAALHGQEDLMELLLQYRADIGLQRQGATGQTFCLDPLHLALAYRHYRCAKLLMRHGAEPSVSSSCPYHALVTQRSHWHFARLLYEFGVRLWLRDKRGQLPWEVVAQSPWAEMRDEEEEEEKEEEEGRELMEFLERVRDHPRSLKSCCRLSVWRHVRRLKKTAASLSELPCIPQAVQQYLSFELL